MRSLRVRTHRGQVVVTGGGVPIAMTADEARAFARAVIAEADKADPIQGDRAFGEEQTPDVPAPAWVDPFPRIGPTSLEVLRDRMFNRAPDETVEDVVRRAMILGSASYEVDVRAGAINLVDVDR